jgi:GWxTD domain-containing protein
MRQTVFLFALFFASTATASAPDPGDALDHARALIATKEYRDAASVLEGAIVDAASMPDPALRQKALAAVHFYSAVAYSGLGDDRNAVQHIEEVIRLSPNARIAAPSKYEAHFVETFNSVVRRLSEPDTFDAIYPGFRTFTLPPGHEPEPGTWGDSPVLLILGSRQEKRKWDALTNTADRQRFIEDFWKRRDPNPATPKNEFRDEFQRRVAFADQAFASEEEHGSLTDRGKVFILLGPPAFARQRPITNRDRIWIAEAATINGTIEQWIYTREQLPVKTAKPTLMYRFVTQKGIGDGVLQRESALAMQALAVAAANPNKAQ